MPKKNNYEGNPLYEDRPYKKESDEPTLMLNIYNDYDSIYDPKEPTEEDKYIDVLLKEYGY